MEKWKKGSGVLLLGTMMLLVFLSLYVYFANALLIKQQDYDTQTAADSISDGVASYMAHGNKDYSDAKKEGNKIKRLIYQYTGLQLDSISIDQKKLERGGKVSVDVSSSRNVLTMDKEEIQYHTSFRHAATLFNTSQLKNIDAVIQWGADSAPYAVYSNTNRTGIGTNGYISSTDCSGFVWLLYNKMGCTAPLWYTGDMASYFDIIPPASAKKGDAIFITADERGSSMGHAKIYCGNGQTLEMGGTHSGIHYGTIDLNNMNGYHFGRIKPEYMGKLKP